MTGEPPTYRGKDGKTYALRNLKEEFLAAALSGLNVDTPENSCLSFDATRVRISNVSKSALSSHPIQNITDPTWNWTATPLIEVGCGMTFHTPSRVKKRQRRKRMPRQRCEPRMTANDFTSYTGQPIDYLAQDPLSNGYIPQVQRFRCRQANYSESHRWTDVELLEHCAKEFGQTKVDQQEAQNMINYDEMGPGYLSAYGLVAGYFVLQGATVTMSTEVFRLMVRPITCLCTEFEPIFPWMSSTHESPCCSLVWIHIESSAP